MIFSPSSKSFILDPRERRALGMDPKEIAWFTESAEQFRDRARESRASWLLAVEMAASPSEELPSRSLAVWAYGVELIMDSVTRGDGPNPKYKDVGREYNFEGNVAVDVVPELVAAESI